MLRTIAKEACEVNLTDHFADVGKMVEIGVSYKNVKDIQLTKYTCYLIVQNREPRKKAIALAQTDFAIQTRKQEITEQEYKELSEDERRLYTRLNLRIQKNMY